MLKIITLAAVMLLASGTMAMAACPSQVPGSTSEAIRANQQRVLCLQRELANAGRVQQYQMDLNKLETRVQKLELQRRFDILPRPVPIPPRQF